MTPKVDQKPSKQRKLSSYSLPQVLSKKNLPWIIIGVLLVVSVFLFTQYRGAQHKLNGSAEDTKDQQNLGKLILLPTGEKPSVAAVKDVDKLKSQSFFKDARQGDKVFVYNTARKAILYRPSTRMIINVQPIAPKTNP